MQWDIGLELGETSVRLATRDKGVVFHAPAWGAFRGGELIAIGEEALAMRGRTPPSVAVDRPLAAGCIRNPRLAGQWIKQLLAPFTSAGRLFKPNVALMDTGFYKQSEKELLAAAVLEVGAGVCGFLPTELAQLACSVAQPLRPEGTLVVSARAGTMSAALTSFGRTVAVRRLPYGFAAIDDAIAHILRAEEGLSVGARMAEDLKLQLASALPAGAVTAQAVGLDTRTGLPAARAISAVRVEAATAPVLEALIRLIQTVVTLAPEELAADLVENGILLGGGGAALSGLDDLLIARCALPVLVPENPADAAIRGLAKLLRRPELAGLVAQVPLSA